MEAPSASVCSRAEDTPFSLATWASYVCSGLFHFAGQLTRRSSHMGLVTYLAGAGRRRHLKHDLLQVWLWQARQL